MKKISFISLFLTLFLLISVTEATAQRGDDTERVSKNGKLEGTIDGVNLVLEYGRPKVKERVIWGELVPFDKVWRTGANEANTFTIDKDITVEGEKLAAGTYSLFTIPGKEEWTVIFNTVAKQWGSMRYDESKDALRVTVKPAAADHVEEMTFHIHGNQVVLHWEKLSVGFTVAAK
jgi:hypothetical protein